MGSWQAACLLVIRNRLALRADGLLRSLPYMTDISVMHWVYCLCQPTKMYCIYLNGRYTALLNTPLGLTGLSEFRLPLSKFGKSVDKLKVNQQYRSY